MRVGLNQWRESSSLILAAKTMFAPNVVLTDFNYKVLGIKRSNKSEYMPNTYVFPGGTISPADKSRDWLKLYEKFGFKTDSFEKLNHRANRTKIFQADDRSDLPKFLSLRIGAIRETFEECGILICRSYKLNYKERIAKWASFIGGPEIDVWQDKVHDNPEQFLELCHKFEVYPDVWALKEWSNWVTPSAVPVRYDTAFFLASFHQMPAAHAEKQEVQHLEWSTPKEFALRNSKGDILLAPPQCYELSRMGNFLDIDQLSKFAVERSEYGLDRYFPTKIKTDEGMVLLLPGDELYEKYLNPENSDMPFVESIGQCKTKHRMMQLAPYQYEIVTQNFTPGCHHAVPVKYHENSHSNL